MCVKNHKSLENHTSPLAEQMTAPQIRKWKKTNTVLLSQPFISVPASPSFTKWLTMNWLLSVHLFILTSLLLLSSFPFLVHPLPLSSSPFLLFLWYWRRGRKEVCGWVCEALFFFFPSFSLPLLLFLSVLCFWRVKEVNRGPLNVRKEREGPLLVSSLVTIDPETGWITLSEKEGQVGKTSQTLKELSVSFVFHGVNCGWMRCVKYWIILSLCAASKLHFLSVTGLTAFRKTERHRIWFDAI